MIRDETKLLVARQCALAAGQVWSRLEMKAQYAWLTLAENILVTIERKGRVSW